MVKELYPDLLFLGPAASGMMRQKLMAAKTSKYTLTSLRGRAYQTKHAKAVPMGESKMLPPGYVT
jgi:hypothetical protein